MHLYKQKITVSKFFPDEVVALGDNVRAIA
jgi:hypothetical protein